MKTNRFDAIVLGASAGAFRALRVLLPAFPRTLPVIIVIHVSPDHPSRMAEALAPYVRSPLREAEDKERPLSGMIYLAPPGYHLLVEREGTLALSQDEPVHFSRPSIDVLFESAADAFGERLLALLLTGANDDGAAGLSAIHEKGGTTIVQDPAEAEAPEMPAAALKRCTPTLLLQLDEIAAFLGRIDANEDAHAG